MTALIGIVRAINAVLSVIPGLAWAITLLMALSWGGLMHHERDAAIKDKNEAIGAKQQIEGALAQQKKEAAAKLADATAKAKALEAKLAEADARQEIESEKRRMDSKAASVALAADAARNGGRLRDPNAAGCRGSGRGPESQAAASPAPDPDGGGEASGLLSEPLTRLLQRVTDEAQGINDAYAVCRARTLTIQSTWDASP
jgi:hypothetical protein